MTASADILEGLNPAQREAVEHIDGPLLIIAGPGSGKTRVITHRIAYLVRVCGVSPFRILSMTFTNKAAREMKDRMERLVPGRGESLRVGTFHSFCALLLRREGERIGLPAAYSIFDADDQLGLIKQAMEMAEVDSKRVPPQAVRSVISRAKSVLMDSRGLAQHSENYIEEQAARIYHHYEELLSRNNAVDFDDLLMRVVQLLQEHQDIREKYQERYQYLMVDEFQDTNVAQYHLARLVAGERQNICVVGDPDQSIYSWRGADVRNILSFQQDYPQARILSLEEKDPRAANILEAGILRLLSSQRASFQQDYPEARIISLEQNYRSTGNILEVAQGLISANGMRRDKKLFTDNGQGDPVVIHEVYNEEDEADFAISEVDRLIREEKHKAGDCAIMYRVNAQSRAFEEACLRRGMKYRLVGGVRFYLRREVKDLVAFLRLINNLLDEVSLTRIINVPPRGIGPKSIFELTRWAQNQEIPTFTAMRRIADARVAKLDCPVPLTKRAANSIADFANMVEELVQLSGQIPVVDLIDDVLERAGFRQYLQDAESRSGDRRNGDRPEERWENVQEFRNTALEFNAEDSGDGLASLLERVSLVAEVDSYEEEESSLTLITLHQAKGLEFPVVFIVGLEEGILPHSRSIETDARMGNDAQLEEERRLCYVGITRAQKRLYLLRAFRRVFMGYSGPTDASRFLREIPGNLLSAPQQSRPITTSSRTSQWTGWAAPITSDVPPAPSRPVPHIGELVRHSVFGEGVVMDCVEALGDHEVTVHFEGDVGVKRLLLSFARLEKVGG